MSTTTHEATTERAQATPKRAVTLIGNLTRSPQLARSESGTVYARFGLAVNRQERNYAGEWEDLPPEFFEVVCFGTLAENTATSLTKGDRAVVAGMAETETWAADAGAPRQTEKVTAEAVGAELRWARVKVARRHVANEGGSQ